MALFQKFSKVFSFLQKPVNNSGKKIILPRHFSPSSLVAEKKEPQENYRISFQLIENPCNLFPIQLQKQLFSNFYALRKKILENDFIRPIGFFFLTSHLINSEIWFRKSFFFLLKRILKKGVNGFILNRNFRRPIRKKRGNFFFSLRSPIRLLKNNVIKIPCDGKGLEASSNLLFQ